MTATANRKKVRYHDRDTNGFVWAFPDDLPDYEKERLAALAQGPVALDGPEMVNDYGPDIEQWRDELRTAVANMRLPGSQIFTLRARAEQFKLAIDTYTAAQFVPALATQFGSYRADFYFKVPPDVEEYNDMSPQRHGTAHRYVTADPVEIAYLRTIADYTEVPVGFVYGRGKGERDGLWVDLSTYERQKAAGQVA